MTLSEKLLNKLNILGIEYYSEGDADHTCVYLNGKQLVAFNDKTTITLFNECGSVVKEYKNIASAIKATM